MITVGLIGQNEIAEQLSQNKQFNVVFNVDGVGAREVLNKYSPDVVLTELVMAGARTVLRFWNSTRILLLLWFPSCKTKCSW